MRRYVLGDVKSEDIFINRMKFLGTNRMNTALLLGLNIV